MFLELSNDQQLFRETAVRFIETKSPLTQVRSWHSDPAGYHREWLAKAAELGWFAQLIPESLGGGSISGHGVVDTSIIALELGRFVQPGPFLSMNLVVFALAQSTSEAHHDTMWAIAGGEIVATWAWADADGNRDKGAGVHASKSGDGFVLNGVRGLVQDAQSADMLLVVANVDGAPAQFLVPANAQGVTVSPLQTLDLSRRFAEVSLDGVQISADALVGETGDTSVLERQWQIANVLLCAESIGVIDWLFDNTVEYSKARTAFGRPIGSYQSLKHIMADLGLYVELAKAGAVAAVESVQSGGEEAQDAVAMAASFVGDAAVLVSQEALQIHGGIGYTWEHDLHLFLRRARANSLMFGSPTWHREQLVAQHGL